MVNPVEPVIYHSYLLRCWQVSPGRDDEPSRWRFALREVAAEPVERDFATLDDLYDFLSQETAARPAPELPDSADTQL